MIIETNKEDLLSSLQKVAGVVEKRQTLPILANVMVTVEKGKLTFIGTDMEIEIQTSFDVKADSDGAITLPARKLLEIARCIEDDSSVQIEVKQDKALFKSGRSRFTLSVLPSTEFPIISPTASELSFKLNEAELKRLFEKTQFAMAHQDVRYYLNGMLIEIRNDLVRSVATDGHRLAVADIKNDLEAVDSVQQVILPRKAVMELNRLLNYSNDEVGIEITSNHVRFYLNDLVLTSKVIDGRFPDYERVIPKNSNKEVIIERFKLKNALQRASILSNEKYRGIRFSFNKDLLQLQAHNPEQEVAEEDMEIDYSFDPLTIGFNVSYVLDVLNNLDVEKVALNLHDENSSALIHADSDISARYVVMPMRL